MSSLSRTSSEAVAECAWQDGYMIGVVLVYWMKGHNYREA